MLLPSEIIWAEVERIRLAAAAKYRKQGRISRFLCWLGWHDPDSDGRCNECGHSDLSSRSFDL